MNLHEPITLFMLAAAVITAISLAMTAWNLTLYRRPRAQGAAPDDIVSVCIPARNEEANIGPCARALLAGTHANIEILVYDDQSTDATPDIIEQLQRDDTRVRRVPTVLLPAGWNGKQHACWRMAQAAKGRWLLFTDADVRFAPGAVDGALAAARAGGPREHGLVSAFPRQVTGSLAEMVVVPMIFFILFSYLPLVSMRRSRSPSASAGCGQFLFVRRDAYDGAGGHEAFKDSMHDGIRLPRAVRRAGFTTDLFDGTGSAECRMYRDFASVWRGFAKNAYEGLGSVGLLVFLTVLHALGHIAPWLVLFWSLFRPLPREAVWLAIIAAGLPFLQRLLIAARLRSSVLGALLHPFGVVLMTLIQWHSLYLHVTGRRAWRGRTQGLPAAT